MPGGAFDDLQVSSGGRVGPGHNFHRDIPLPVGTEISVFRLPTKAKVYEAATIIARKDYHAPNLARLRDLLRVIADSASMSSRHLVNRRALGYRRAPFRIDYRLMDAARREGSVMEGEDRFASYTQWRIETGWEEGAVIPERKNGSIE